MTMLSLLKKFSAKEFYNIYLTGGFSYSFDCFVLVFSSFPILLPLSALDSKKVPSYLYLLMISLAVDSLRLSFFAALEISWRFSNTSLTS